MRYTPYKVLVVLSTSSGTSPLLSQVLVSVVVPHDRAENWSLGETQEEFRREQVKWKKVKFRTFEWRFRLPPLLYVFFLSYKREVETGYPILISVFCFRGRTKNRKKRIRFSFWCRLVLGHRRVYWFGLYNFSSSRTKLFGRGGWGRWLKSTNLS